MIDKIVINQDRTRALITYTDKHSITVSHDQGLVLDLIVYLLTPSINPSVTYNNYINSLEDTQPIIDLRKVA